MFLRYCEEGVFQSACLSHDPNLERFILPKTWFFDSFLSFFATFRRFLIDGSAVYKTFLSIVPTYQCDQIGRFFALWATF